MSIIVIRKVWAARVSVLINLMLVTVKLAVGLVTGSVSVLSEAVNSATDVLVAGVALFGVTVSSQPADTEHQYGHGKVESLAAMVVGAIVLGAGGWIVVEALKRLAAGNQMPQTGLALWVMGISAVVKWVLSGYLLRVSRQEESMVLEADALQQRVDVWTSAGVFGGLLLVRYTGLAWLDPVAGAIVAGLILKVGWELCARAMQPLVDARLPAEEEEEIICLIERHEDSFVEFHDLRTRRSGAERHVDFHLVVHGRRSLEEVHRLCDQIEQAISRRFPQAQVLIHPEPCGDQCDFCRGERVRKHRWGSRPAPGRQGTPLVRRQALARPGLEAERT